MATCAVQDLLSAEPCWLSQSPHMQLVLEVQLLCNLLDKIVSSGAVTCDIQTLLTQAKCFIPFSDQVLRALKLQLLCEISSAL